jgi:predicted Zn finger-like uncharacterized protein
MNIICPHCETSYDVQPAALGPSGRTVRCVRCRETWHAQIADAARADALVQAADEIGWNQPSAGGAMPAAPAQESADHEVPQIESPPLVHDAAATHDWRAESRDGMPARPRPTNARRPPFKRFAFGSGPTRGLSVSPPMAIAAMAALALALIIWRNDVVRLLPQTAAFFQMTGLGVNLRGLAFEDVRVSSETVNGSKVFVIEGAIAPTARKVVEIPRLRFVVQNARGADVYAWNSVVDQAVVQPGEKVTFRSRLASPPADAHSVVVRFFHRRDLTSGGV